MPGAPARRAAAARVLVRQCEELAAGGPPRLRGAGAHLVAILRRMRRMILPERVLGRPGAQWMTSGVAMGPMTSRTVAISSFFSAGGGGYSVPCAHGRVQGLGF